jgi:cytochrome c biogenesis protein CcmG, thiol:disulfide interchange protein DsbE
MLRAEMGALNRRNVVYAVVAVAVVGAIAGIVLLDRGSGSAAPGGPAAALPREVLVPPRATLASLRGRPAAIVFWASWCEPCRREAPGFARLARRLHGRASLVGVDWEDERGPALAFVKRYGWTFPVLRATGLSGGRYGVVGLPTTLVLDRAGRISSILRGPQTAADLARALGLRIRPN